MASLAGLSDLSGRVVLVSGGAGHIARAAVTGLLELGAAVGVLDATAARCEEACAALGGRNVFPLPCDLASEDDTRATVRRFVADRRRLDILIHTAALMTAVREEGWSEPIERQSVAMWDRALRINLTSAFVLTQESYPALASSGHGSVIYFASTYGIVGPDMRIYAGTSMQNPAAYGVSKSGLVLLARHLATVFAPSVRVNSITPGGIERGQPRSFVERYVERTPLGRMATEEDLKGAVAYLASDLSAYVTGHNLVVDGGWTAW